MFARANSSLARASTSPAPARHISTRASSRPTTSSSITPPEARRILVVRVVVAPVRTAAVQLVVEDPAGRAAPLSVYHVPTRFVQKELDELWPVGAVFGIKEPLVRTLRTGYHIRVDSPGDLVRLFPSSPLLRNVSFPPSPSHHLDGKSVSHLKDVGNTAFKRGRWIAAKEAYEWAISALEGHSGDDCTLRAAVLSNLALTNLKLLYAQSARRAAQEGLDLVPASVPPEPLRAKLLYRFALSLFALEQYDDCLAALDPLLSSSEPDTLAASLASRARVAALQAAHGPSPRTLRTLFTARPPSDDTPPDVADFVSPLVGIRTLPQRGRALVALEAIPRGTLLAAVKPLATAGGVDAARGRSAFCAGVNVWTRGMDPWAVGEVAAEVLWRAAVDEGEEGLAHETLRELWAGEELARFSEREGDARGAEADPSRAEGVVTFNAFHVEDLAAASALPGAQQAVEEDDEGFHARVALYPPFPSALNHSCIPTASYTFLRGVFLLRARVALAPGDELTDSYADASEPLDARAAKLAPHGFVCTCALCTDERNAGAAVRAERARIAHQLDAGVLADPDGDDEVARVRALRTALQGTYAALTDRELEEGAARPPLYTASRLLAARLIGLPRATDAHRREAVGVEVDALRALGAVLEPGAPVGGDNDGWERARLARPPRVGDTNAVLSALFVARVYRGLGREAASRHWVALAREIEAGQGGVELFVLRFGPWARKQGLELPEEGGEDE